MLIAVTNTFVFLVCFIFVILMLYFVTGPHGRTEGYIFLWIWTQYKEEINKQNKIITQRHIINLARLRIIHDTCQGTGCAFICMGNTKTALKTITLRSSRAGRHNVFSSSGARFQPRNFLNVTDQIKAGPSQTLLNRR